MVSFNPKPEAMAGGTYGRSIPLAAIASGFGLNEQVRFDNARIIVSPCLRGGC